MTKHTCEKCGATLPAEGAPCRRCLMELAASWKPEAGAEPVTSGVPRPGTPPPQPAELAPLFPELEIESLLGAGGMGAVYKARQKRLGRAVALKVLHGELSGDPMFVERFLREAQALAKLAHPGIVAVHDFGERERRCYLVMEYVDGANLRALLKQGLLAPRQALDIVRQLCDALQFAHDEGVVHRDIKPENVLVDGAGRVKIADFGLAKLVGGPAQASLTSAGQVMGTPHYMAPEQVEHPRDVDHRADLFSLGVVFYEMLTGELPLGRFAPPSQRVQVDVRLDEIVLKTLERERERRYQQAVEVKTDVERVEREPGGSLHEALPAAAPFVEIEFGTEQARHRHSLRLRSGVYLPDIERLFGKHPPTDWGWLALFFAAWVVSALCWNGGVFWFALGAVPLLSWMFLSMVSVRAGVAKAADEKLGPWVGRIDTGAFTGAALGFVALTLANVSSWERWTWDYASSDQRPAAGLERLRGKETALVREFGVSLEDPNGLTAADLRLEPVSLHSTTNPDQLLALPSWAFLGLALALLYFAGRSAIPVERRSALTWRQGVGSSLAMMMAALLLLAYGALAFQGGHMPSESVQASRACRGNADELARGLYQVLVENELHVHAEVQARVVDRRSGAELVRVHTLAAAQSSVFDRWSLSWSGPRRTEPHVLFTVLSDPSGEHALIRADAGRVMPDHLELGAWRTRLDEQISAACAGSK